MALTRHHTASAEKQQACLADIYQICSMWHPLLDSGISFPAPFIGVCNLGGFSEGLCPDHGCREQGMRSFLCLGGLSTTSDHGSTWTFSLDSLSLHCSSYSTWVQCSPIQHSRRRACTDSSVRILGSWVRVMKVFVTSWKAAHSFHEAFLPMPNIADWSLHFVYAWKGSASQFWGSIICKIGWIGIFLHGFPDSNPPRPIRQKHITRQN